MYLVIPENKLETKILPAFLVEPHFNVIITDRKPITVVKGKKKYTIRRESPNL